MGKKPGVRGESTKQHLQAIAVTHNKEFQPYGEKAKEVVCFSLSLNKKLLRAV